MTERPGRWVSIDPGDRHVGYAKWLGDDCMSAVELTPEGLEAELEELTVTGWLHTIVYEKFSLYAWNEKSLAGNEFLTSQLIGVIKYIGKKGGCELVSQSAATGKRIYKMGWYLDLTPAELRQMPWWGNGGHAKDAWCHGEWFRRQRKAN